MERDKDSSSSPPPYPGLPPTARPVESPLADSGCLPPYQGRSKRRYHPYPPRPPPRAFRHSDNTILDFMLGLSSTSPPVAPVAPGPPATSPPATSTTSGTTHTATVSSAPAPVFDPENDHHRRLLRLRSVLPEFIFAIRLALARSRQGAEVQVHAVTVPEDDDSMPSPPPSKTIADSSD